MQRITAQNAPEAIGPYSHAIRTGNLLITSGQIPVDPSTGSLVADLIEDQTNQVIANLKVILENEGLSLMNVVKTTVFLKDMSEFAQFNSVYEKHFESHKPARSTVQVASLPLNCRVEIEAIAEIEAL
ncbi:MAG: RidA family protein [Verrucomicrobiota bacterium]|nr:RidA family protein [Verrucomicrobiota bacterium]